MKDALGCGFFLLLLWGAGAVIINFWPVILILTVIGVVVLIAHAYEPPPDPKREIREAEREAKQAINKAGKAYRKQVNDLTK